MSASRASVLLRAGSQGNKEKGEELEDLKGVIKKQINFVFRKCGYYRENLNVVCQNSERV